MSAAQADGEGFGLVRHREQMYVIAHEAISKDSKQSLRTVGLEALQVGAAISIREENALLVNAALCDMVRPSDGDRTRKSTHLLGKWTGELICLFVPCLSVPEVPEVPKSPDLSWCCRGIRGQRYVAGSCLS